MVGHDSASNLGHPHCKRNRPDPFVQIDWYACLQLLATEKGIDIKHGLFDKWVLFFTLVVMVQRRTIFRRPTSEGSLINTISTNISDTGVDFLV